MKQYKEVFERIIKGASSKVKCIDEKSELWMIPRKERNILFCGYDFGLNRSSVETVCKDKYLTWTLLN